MLKGFLKLAVGSLVAFAGANPAPAALADEPEASPLYVGSLQGAFADMTARDHGLTRVQNRTTRVPVGSGAVIVVDGTQWYNGSATERGGLLATRLNSVKNAQLGPLDLTMTSTCIPGSTFCTTCLPSSCVGPTCVQTCDPAPTCGNPTCKGDTCYPSPTCLQPYPGSTCGPGSTCAGTGPTCTSTCVPASCPTTLYNVSVPEAGQIQLSFNSSAQLKYVLQYCTNLSAASWVEACSTNGNGGVLTLCHTNGAAFSVYRLLIQYP